MVMLEKLCRIIDCSPNDVVCFVIKRTARGRPFLCVVMSGNEHVNAPCGLAVLVGGNGAVQHGGDVVHDHLIHGDAQIIVGGGIDEAVVGVAAAAIKSLVAMV